MTSDEFLSHARNPAVLGELKQLLGLPEIVEALHEVEETLCRMDHRIDLLSEAIFRLTEAQARTDQKVERLTGKVEELTEAQVRTEATLERFMEKTERFIEKTERFMVKTDRSIAELQAGQARTEATLDRFMIKTEATHERFEKNFVAIEKNFVAIRKELGALSETAGLDVEEIVSAELPEWLRRHYEITVELQCPFFLGDEELDGFGEGLGPNGTVTILAEAKNRVRTREVEAFCSKAERVRAVVPGTVFPVLIARALYPDAIKRADELGLTVVSTRALRR